jgi:hypothetical protein
MTDAKFELFWKAVKDGPYDLPDEMKASFQAAIKTAGYDQASAGGTVTVTKLKKKVNGYNLFMKEQTAKLKADNVAPDQRMAEVAKLWKLLTDADKLEWKAKAAALPDPVGTTTTVVQAGTPTSRSLTGYQLYVRETMPQVKADTTIPAKSRMAKIGSLWKALEKDKQGEFSTRAKGMMTNSPVAATTPTTAE